jgi:tryptophan halogenase
MPTSQSDFGIEGYFTMLVGNKVPYRKRHPATAAEMAVWNAHRQALATEAKGGLDVKESLAYVRDPRWRWFGETQA